MLFPKFASILAIASSAFAANSFAGSNLYYAAGLSSSQQDTLFSAMKSAGMKVLRVWVDGESTATTKNTPITSYPSVEPNTIGSYDSTVLNLLDAVMVKAHSFGIKLLISMHSFNALQGGDVYGKIYGTGFFYEQTTPQQQFDNRLRFIMNHNHTTLGKPWKQLKDYIFAFEAQNEAMIGKGADYITAHTQWQCDRANTIKSVLGNNSGILVTTGGESFLSESMQSAWFSCAALDVIAIHAYGVGDFDTATIQNYVRQAQSAGKKLLFQEWGACYFNTENNNCPTGSPLPTGTRNTNIQNWSNQITAAGVPWLYWQIIPNADPHFGSDFEIGVNDPSWSTLQAAGLHAAASSAAFDFSAFLL